MIVTNQRGEHGTKDCFSDPFPVGMRVLAVDDDQVCLKMLERMLMECRYHVTTTTQSIKALEMLRKDKNKFDLVISDVNMPDMDGFKLLETVGLEMDLPVIMLSAHKDTNLVKKGVLHGACDYLLKPCRIEELQNIWQHVFRRQIDFKELSKAFIEEEACNMDREGCQGIASEDNADKNKQLGKRMKEEDEEEAEEEDDDENEHGDEEPSTRKKARLLWDTELHRKFVAAVNQIGLEKAVPKKILELMNVERITRENVASHLQKYRLGLRKAAQQATAAALGGRDPYLRMPSLDPYESSSGRFSSTTLPSYASSGTFSRLSTPPGFNLRGISSSGLILPDQSQNMNGSIKALGSIQPSMFSANQSTNLLQGIPTSFEANQFRQSNYRAGIRQLSPIDNSSVFAVPSVYTKSRAAIVNGNNTLPCFPSNNLLLQGNSPPHNSVAFRNHSSLGTAVTIGSPDIGICGVSNKSIAPMPANSLPLSQAFNNGHLPQSGLKFSSSTSHIGNIPLDFSSRSVIVPFDESKGGLQCQEGLIGSILQASYHTPQQSWQEYNQNKNQTFNSLVPSNGDTSSLGHTSNQDSTNGIKRADHASLAGLVNEATPSTNQCTEPEKLCSDAGVQSDDGCISQRMESQEGVVESDFSSLDDLLGDMVTPEEQHGCSSMMNCYFDADIVGSFADSLLNNQEPGGIKIIKVPQQH